MLTAVLMACIFAAGTVFAAEPGKVLSFGTDDDKIVLYVQDPGEYAEIDALIGTGEPKDISVSAAALDSVPLRTVFMLDNSLSIKEQYRDRIKEIMTEIVANRIPGEQFTVATFDKDVDYVLQDSDDYSRTKQAIDGIEFVNQDTYITDAMYELLTQLNEREDPVFTRIVLISDGVDNNYLGYSKNELYKLIEAHPYPIYTIGCGGSADSEQIKDMSAMARMTGAEAFMMDDIVTPMTVVTGVAGTNDALKVVLEPEAADCDGTIKGVKLTIKTPGGDLKDTVQVQMPSIKSGAAAAPAEEAAPAKEAAEEPSYSEETAAGEIAAAASEEISEEPAEEDDKEAEAEDAEDTESDDEDEEDDEDKTLFEKFRDSKYFLPVLIGIIVLIGAIAAVILISSDKKKKRAAAVKAKAAENRAAAQKAKMDNQLRQNVTSASGRAQNGARPGATVMASQNGTIPRGTPMQPQAQAPQARPQGMPQQVRPQGAPQQPQQMRPQGMPQQMRPQGAPQQPQQMRPQGMPQQAPQMRPQGMPQQAQQVRPQGMPQQAAQTRPVGMPQQAQQVRPQAAPQQAAQTSQAAAPQQTQERRTITINDQPARRTVMMTDEAVPSRILVLQDMANAYKKFEVSLNSPVLVGYNQNCQVRLNYEETVSGEHCLIYQKDDKILIQNKSKTNGTVVDGEKITSDVEIKSGSRLGLGRLTFTVEIRA